MPDKILLIRGDSLGQMPSQPTQSGNASTNDLVMNCKDVMRVGKPEDIIRLVGYQNVPSSTAQFANGQFWRVETWNGPANPTEEQLANPGHWTTLYDNVVPKPDLVSGLGMTSDHVVLEVQGIGRNPSNDYPNANPWDTRHLILSTKQSFPEKPGEVDLKGPPGELEFEDLQPPVLCLTAGTLVLTPAGLRLVEDLKAGDLVMTKDHGAQPVRWIASRKLDAIDMRISARLRPIRIAAGSLGLNMPSSDLLVSPQHRMVVRSKIAGRMMGANEVLVPAKDLLDLPGVAVAPDLESVTYFHVMFDRHEVIFANGAETESFYPGEQAMKAVDQDVLAELLSLFPELNANDDGFAPARSFLRGSRARHLVERHVKNDVALVG